ncbi:MAG: hypothetical protein M1282_04575 [Chloroflexi bacterium]|nr:hypothetical protein [Chloroflexota bacterium]
MAKKDRQSALNDLRLAGPTQEAGYTIEVWAGFDQYHCKKCGFDTLDLGVMIEHLLYHPAGAEVKLEEPAIQPPSAAPLSPKLGTAPNLGEEKQDIYEIDLKEDQHG